MPLYYFHFCTGNDRSVDDIGLDLISAEAAYLEAIAAARVMWSELLAERQDPTRCAFEIANEKDDILFRVELTEVLESCRQAGGMTPSHAALASTVARTHRRVCAAKEELRVSFIQVRKTLDESRMLLGQIQGAGARPLASS